LGYLVDAYAKDDILYPKDVKERALVHARFDFDNGTLWPRAIATVVSNLKFLSTFEILEVSCQ